MYNTLSVIDYTLKREEQMRNRNDQLSVSVQIKMKSKAVMIVFLVYDSMVV